MTLQAIDQMICPTIAPAIPQARNKNPTIAANQPSTKLTFAYPIVESFERASIRLSKIERASSGLRQGCERCGLVAFHGPRRDQRPRVRALPQRFSEQLGVESMARFETIVVRSDGPTG